MLSHLIDSFSNFICTWPLLVCFMGTAIVVTIGLKGIPFKKFFTGFFSLLKISGNTAKAGAEITPLQAFLNALSTSLGNGAIAGIAAAIHLGGPGAGFWIFVAGFFCMILRFSEVYLATSFASLSSTGRVLGGPFLYLKNLPGGKFLPFIYALFCLGYTMIGGCAMQCNSITSALVAVTGVPTLVVTGILVIFVLYSLIGGAQRIVKISSFVIPIKVIMFFVFCTGILIYHWAALIPSINLMIKAALTPEAVLGGAFGLSIQRICSIGLLRTINASEAGLGTAAVIYGSTGSVNPSDDGLSAMLGTFISTNLACFMVALAIVSSGVWNSGVDGSALTALAFETVYGTLGGWIVVSLTVLLGLGVFVTCGFVGRQCWLYLTNDRFEFVFPILFCLSALWGSINNVAAVFGVLDLIVAGCVFINLYGIIWLIPFMRKQLTTAKI